MGDSVNVSAIPLELRELNQWVVFKFQAQPGEPKPRKRPFRASNPAAAADCSDPQTWDSFEQAVAMVDAGHADAIAFAFSDQDPYFGVDLDGEMSAEEQQIVCQSLCSYTERSVSGDGYHVIVRASLNGHPRHRAAGIGLEVYDSKRFFIFTGAHVAGTPTTIEYREAEIDALLAKYLPKFEPVATLARVDPVIPRDQELLDRMF